VDITLAVRELGYRKNRGAMSIYRFLLSLKGKHAHCAFTGRNTDALGFLMSRHVDTLVHGARLPCCFISKRL